MVRVPKSKILVVGGHLKSRSYVRLYTQVFEEATIIPTITVDCDAKDAPDGAIECLLGGIGPRLVTAKLDYFADLFNLTPPDMVSEVNTGDLKCLDRLDCVTAIAVCRSIELVTFTLGYLMRRLVMRSCKVTFKRTQYNLCCEYGLQDPQFNKASEYFDPH